VFIEYFGCAHRALTHNVTAEQIGRFQDTKGRGMPASLGELRECNLCEHTHELRVKSCTVAPEYQFRLPAFVRALQFTIFGDLGATLSMHNFHALDRPRAACGELSHGMESLKLGLELLL
jgi:hypothetical protein